MVERDTDGARQGQPSRKGPLPPELVELFNPSLKFGAGAGQLLVCLYRGPIYEKVNAD